jgi:amidohydrolase
MPIINRVADLQPEIAAWRHDLHAHPELLYDVHRTAASVADKLKCFGCDEVVTGLGRTGVVGVIRGRKAGDKVVGLRADMDALPIAEATDVPYKSTVPGKMHACGHDGHTAMLLGAAKYLADTRNFAGTAVLIFQPAEEGGAGARAMIHDGLFERFGIQKVFGLHNFPGMPVGEFGICSGPMMASTDTINIDLEGIGAHAAWPQSGVDTVLVGAQIVNQLQSIVARNVNPMKAAVISICMFHAGDTDNVIPQQAQLCGTARALSASVRELLKRRVSEIVEGTARAYGAKAKLDYVTGYPVLVNDERQTAFAAAVAGEVAGGGKVSEQFPPTMGAEDFAYMLQERPGAFIWLGNGETAALHNPAYDFNDEAIPVGTSYWVRLAEAALVA